MEYYKNGEMREEGIYIDGIYNIKNWWTETGEQSVVNGTGYQIIKTDAGQIVSEGKYIDSKPEGTWKYYSEQGIPIAETNYKDGKLNGESINYYESGAIYSKGNYVNNLREGIYTWYAWNGQKESEVSFKNGKKEGAQLFWSPITEKIVKQEFYKNGELVEK